MNLRHGMYGTPEYTTWRRIINRCHNSNAEKYSYYGGRGIIVCDKWRYDFLAFYKAVGDKPSKAYSLDRIDNDGNYEPGNVRWATKTEQARNRRVRSDSKVGVRGVGYDPRRNSYYARKFSNGKMKYHGYFKTIEEASRAYQKAAY